jgi:hypothetical protein
MSDAASKPQIGAWPFALAGVLLISLLAAGVYLAIWHSRVARWIDAYERDHDVIDMSIRLTPISAQVVPQLMRRINEAWREKDASRLVYLTYLLSEMDKHSDPSLDRTFEPGSRLTCVAWSEPWETTDASCRFLFGWWSAERSRYPAFWNVFQTRMTGSPAPLR